MPLGSVAACSTMCYNPGMATRTTLNISLTPHLQEFVDQRVASGRYQSASEVIREGLRLLEERDLRRQAARRELQTKIDEGLAAADRGDLHDFDEVFDELLEGLDEQSAG